jgi:hypothetical protein
MSFSWSTYICVKSRIKRGLTKGPQEDQKPSVQTDKEIPPETKETSQSRPRAKEVAGLAPEQETELSDRVSTVSFQVETRGLPYLEELSVRLTPRVSQAQTVQPPAVPTEGSNAPSQENSSVPSGGVSTEDVHPSGLESSIARALTLLEDISSLLRELVKQGTAPARPTSHYSKHRCIRQLQHEPPYTATIARPAVYSNYSAVCCIQQLQRDPLYTDLNV